MLIDLTKKLHQDNLKAEIYHRFKLLRFDDLNLICEYYDSGSRFDLLVYQPSTGNVVCIIEVRRIGVKRAVKPTSKKHSKYSKFSVPIFYISEFCKIGDLLDEIKHEYNRINIVIAPNEQKQG